jgi:hypothetical protein
MSALETKEVREELRECIQGWVLQWQAWVSLLLLFPPELCAVPSVEELPSWDTVGVRRQMPLTWRALKQRNPL